MKKILFLHGLDVKSDEIKKKFLEKKDKDCKVLFPSLPKSSFEESIKIAQDLLDAEDPQVIVSSDRGAAVSLCLDLKNSKLVLVAPTWDRYVQSKNILFPNQSMVILSKNDSVVDFKITSDHIGKSSSNFIIAGNSHSMTDSDALEALLDAVNWSMRRK